MRVQKCQGRKPFYSLGNSWGAWCACSVGQETREPPPPIALSSQFSVLAGYWLSQHSHEEFCGCFLTVPPRVGRGTPWYLEMFCHPLLEGLS